MIKDVKTSNARKNETTATTGDGAIDSRIKSDVAA